MNKEILIKQLLYRSSHRGCKETDVLLGNFFNLEYKKFKEEELNLYNEFIEEDDLLIYDWILDKEKTPEKYGELIKRIRLFHNI